MAQFACLALALVACVVAAPAPQAAGQPNPAYAVSVSLSGAAYVNKVRSSCDCHIFYPSINSFLQGLVAFGLIPSNFKESTGDTLGGIGSAVAIKPASWKSNSDGSYSGTFVAHPDRGYNV